MLEKCLCPKEVATLLGISERTAIRLMLSRQLAAFKVNGKLWRTTASRVRAYQSTQFARWAPEAAA